MPHWATACLCCWLLLTLTLDLHCAMARPTLQFCVCGKANFWFLAVLLFQKDELRFAWKSVSFSSVTTAEPIPSATPPNYLGHLNMCFAYSYLHCSLVCGHCLPRLAVVCWIPEYQLHWVAANKKTGKELVDVQRGAVYHSPCLASTAYCYFWKENLFKHIKCCG